MPSKSPSPPNATAKAETARRNGARSQGPITPEGKHRSSLNSLKHGLYSKQVVLSTEDPAEYGRLLATYTGIFLPANAAESDLVEDLVNTLWRLRRVWQWQDSLLEIEMEQMREEAAKRFPQGLTNRQREALAFTNLSQKATEAIHFFDRFDSRYRRAYDRSLKNLIALQRLRNAEHLTNLPDNVLHPERPEPPLPDAAPPPAAPAGHLPGWNEPTPHPLQTLSVRLAQWFLQFIAILCRYFAPWRPARAAKNQ